MLHTPSPKASCMQYVYLLQNLPNAFGWFMSWSFSGSWFERIDKQIKWHMKTVLRWMRERQKLRLIYEWSCSLTTNLYIQLGLQNPTSIRQNQLIIPQNQSSLKGLLTRSLLMEFHFLLGRKSQLLCNTIINVKLQAKCHNREVFQYAYWSYSCLIGHFLSSLYFTGG